MLSCLDLSDVYEDCSEQCHVLKWRNMLELVLSRTYDWRLWSEEQDVDIEYMTPSCKRTLGRLKMYEPQYGTISISVVIAFCSACTILRQPHFQNAYKRFFVGHEAICCFSRGTQERTVKNDFHFNLYRVLLLIISCMILMWKVYTEQCHFLPSAIPHLGHYFSVPYRVKALSFKGKLDIFQVVLWYHDIIWYKRTMMKVVGTIILYTSHYSHLILKQSNHNPEKTHNQYIL